MMTRTLWIAGLVVVAWSAPARAQQPTACTPVLLCPQAGTGGPPTGGRGGGGAGGRGGTGGRGGAGGQPAAGLVITAALELDKRVVKPAQVLNASVTYGNTGSSTIAVSEIRIAARAPGASHAGGPFTDLSPILTNLNLEPGQHITLSASRTFVASDTPGEWEAYATHQDAAGWHDAPSERFAVIASAGPTPPPSGQMSVGTQAWYIAPWAGTPVYKSGVDWATAYAAGVDIWNPVFLADIQGFVVWRHMDTNATNFSKISRWSQRKLPTDPRNQEVYIDGASSSDTTGMAVEWQIDLCNRANIDCWFTHPYLADDDYLRQQATLVKAKLSPALRVYIELSNEVWNGAFSAQQQAINAGKAGGLPGSNEYQGIAHELFRALQMYEIYKGVFGAAAMGERVIRVFSESGNLDLTTQALKNVYESSHWNPQGQRIDMIGLAPYIGSGINGASETLSRWKTEVDAKVNDPIGYVKTNHAEPYNIPLVGCYEAGMHHLQNAKMWAENPSVYDGYVYMLDRFATKMNAPCVLYTLHGTWENTQGKGAWGLYNNVGQALSAAPKARGTKEWIAGTATREVGVTVRVLIIVLIIIAFLALAWFVCMRLYAARSRRSSSPPAPPPPSSELPPEP